MLAVGGHLDCTAASLGGVDLIFQLALHLLHISLHLLCLADHIHVHAAAHALHAAGVKTFCHNSLLLYTKI